MASFGTLPQSATPAEAAYSGLDTDALIASLAAETDEPKQHVVGYGFQAEAQKDDGMVNLAMRMLSRCQKYHSPWVRSELDRRITEARGKQDFASLAST